MDVAIHAAYRQRGYSGNFMRVALAGMRQRSVHLSMLHPCAYSFYRRYRWKLATEAISYRLKPADLPISSGQKRIRAYREGDLALMIMLVEGES